MKTKMLLLASAATLLAAPSALAQTIDYGSLELLFDAQVTTSATGAPQVAADAPAPMDIISAEDIRRSGARTIPDILATVPGVDVRRMSQGGVEVNIRGYNQAMSPRLLVLVNRRQVYLDHHGFTDWDLIPVELSEIRQIEVVKGPNTALFGFNAVSGVVNIITYNPLYDDADAATVRVGTQSAFEGSGVTTIKLGDKVGLRLSAGLFEAEEFEDAAALLGTQSVDPQRRSVAAELLAQVAPKVQVGAEATLSDGERMDLIPSYSAEAASYDTWSGRGYVAADTRLGLINATLYHNGLEVTGSSDDFGSYQIESDVTVLQAEDLFKISADHGVRIAGEFRHNELGGASFAPREFDLLSASGMWNWSISDALTWTNALRFDSMALSGEAVGDRTVEEYSVNSGLVFKPTADDTFRLSAARGVQAPTLVELTFNYMIDPAIVTNFELGYDRPTPWTGGAFSGGIFFQQHEDVKSFGLSFTPTGAVVAVQNIGESESWGAELELDGAVADDWTWALGYLYQDVSDDLANFVQTPFGMLQSQPAIYELSTAEHIINGELGYTRSQWELDLFVRGVSETEQTFFSTLTGYAPDDVPAYLSTGARVGFKVSERASIEVSGHDLTNDGDEQFARLGVEPRAYLTLNMGF